MKFNLLDYLIIGILLYSIIQGFRKGLLESLGGIIGTVGALAAAYIYRQDTALYLEKTLGLKEIMTAAVEKKIPLPTIGQDPSGLLSSINTALHAQCENMAHLLIVGISFVLLFLLVSLAVKLAFQLLDKIFGWGLLGSANRLAGVVIVAAKNMIIIAVMIGIFSPMIDKGSKMGLESLTTINALLNSSVVAPHLMTVFIALEKVTGIGV
jgi:uncharacterized membrane protein required for colicin V production